MRAARSLVQRGGDAGAAARAAPTAAARAAAYAAEQAAAVAHMGAHAFGAAGYAAKASTLHAGSDDYVVRSEARRQVSEATDSVVRALASLPALGDNRSGPLAPGRLSLGQVGETIREIRRLLSERAESER
jgi:alkylation response protein AidB-like acyl-CoA dehydrogenase